MSNSCDVLWISTCQGLRQFDTPLLYYLEEHVNVAIWEYEQSLDESSSISLAVELLYSYLKLHQNPVDLIGHGINGVVALVFARKYPQHVRSLTLLSVASEPGNTWHAFYYKRRQLFDASAKEVLVYTIRSMFGEPLPLPLIQLLGLFYNDLEKAPTTHSILNIMKIPSGGADVPMMVCGSKNDAIVTESELRGWLTWHKQGDVFQQFPSGHHFFHYYYPQETGAEILKFWQQH